jgi:hypothetical protein
MARLVARDDFPLPVIEELRLLGHDIVTVPAEGVSRDVSPGAKPRVWLTLDPDQSAGAHRAAPAHSGIVAVKPGKTYAGLAQRIHDALKAHARISRQLVVVDGAADDAGAAVETPNKPRRRRPAAGIAQE